jgi:hypothetical protein
MCGVNRPRPSRVGFRPVVRRRRSRSWRRIAVARDEQAPPVGIEKVARSPRATARRLTSSVEIVHVRGPDAAHLAEFQLEAIKEVLQWALSQRTNEEYDEDRAA